MAPQGKRLSLNQLSLEDQMQMEHNDMDSTWKKTSTSQSLHDWGRKIQLLVNLECKYTELNIKIFKYVKKIHWTAFQVAISLPDINFIITSNLELRVSKMGV